MVDWEARIQQAISLRKQGLRNHEIATVMGLDASRVSQCLRMCGVPLPQITPSTPSERTKHMIALYKEGKTLEEVARPFNLTRERVRQILRRHGINKSSGGIKKRAEIRNEDAIRARQAFWDEATIRYYGCSSAELARINNGQPRSRQGSPANMYYDQMHNAAYRGIEWKLTLPVWWHIWQESGKWDQRGRGKDKYCMARDGDAGPYAVGNVRIILCEQNASESYHHVSATERYRKRLAALGEVPNPFDMTPRQKSAAEALLVGLTYRQWAEREGIDKRNAWAYFHAAKKKLELIRRVHEPPEISA